MQNDPIDSILSQCTAKLPRLGTAARVVLMAWEMRGGLVSWSTLEEVYMGALRNKGSRAKRCHITSNLSRLLKRYGKKLGPSCSKAQWKLNIAGTIYPPLNSGASKAVTASIKATGGRNLRFVINAGKDSCSSEPGVFCRYAMARINGSEPFCTLFQCRLPEPLGFAYPPRRLQECIDHEENA